MRKIINFNFLFNLFTLFFYQNDNLICQWWEIDKDTDYLYRDNTDFTNAELTPQPFCQCKDMIKPGIWRDGQTNDELYLRGGLRYLITEPPPPTYWECQEMNLNVCACNGNNITQIDIRLPYDLNNPCLSNLFRFALLHDDVQHTVEYLSPAFNPNQNQFTTINIEPPILSGFCRVLKIWICSPSLPCSGMNNIDITFQIFNENCIRTMTFHFDRPLGVDWIYKNNLKYIESSFLSDFNKSHSNSNDLIQYKILNVLNHEIESGNLSKKDDFNNLQNNLNIQPGLYLIQLIKDNNVIRQYKIFKNY